MLLLVVIFSIFLIVILYLSYAGLFRNVDIKVKKPQFPIGGHYFYKFYQMNYREGAGQAFRAIGKFPIKQCHKKVGIYYDDPKKVQDDKTRFTVGILMSGSNIDEELAVHLRNVGFQHVILPEINSIVTTTFHLTTILSILFAVSKVYPKLSEYAEANKLMAHPYMEYYDDENQVHFVAPLEKNDQFYVQEFHCTPVVYMDGSTGISC